MEIINFKIIRKCIFLLIIISNPLFAQSKNLTKEEMEAFLVGLFDHFSGDTYIPSHPILKNRFTFLLNGKENVCKIFKDSLEAYSVKNDFPFLILSKRTLEVYKMQEINPFEKYYIMKLDTDCFYYDEETDKDYERFNLYLNKKAFKEKRMKLLFLLGAFINDGEIGSDYYFFRGKPQYIDFITGLLKDLKIEIVEIILPKKATTGNVKVLKFRASGDLENLLEQNEKLWKHKFF